MVCAALLCILVFLFLAHELAVGGLGSFDRTVTGWIRPDITPGLTSWMILTTDLGSTVFIACLTTFAAFRLLTSRKLWDALGVAAASLGGWLLYVNLKLVFLRPRPALPQLDPAAGYSFPSGHATVSAALFLTLALVYCHHADSRTGKILAMAGAALLVLLVGISRVYLGVHYPSDVVAGWAAGGFLAVAIDLLLRLDFRTNRRCWWNSLPLCIDKQQGRDTKG
jgi:undecaprenyl-diphosphatase